MTTKQEVIKKKQWDLPSGWKMDDEMVRLVTSAAQDAITQRKSVIKGIVSQVVPDIRNRKIDANV